MFPAAFAAGQAAVCLTTVTALEIRFCIEIVVQQKNSQCVYTTEHDTLSHPDSADNDNSRKAMHFN